MKNNPLRLAVLSLCGFICLSGGRELKTDSYRTMAAKMALFQSETELRIYRGLYEYITIKNTLNRIKSQSISGTAERYSVEIDLAQTVTEAQRILQKIRRLENIQAVKESK